MHNLLLLLLWLLGFVLYLGLPYFNIKKNKQTNKKNPPVVSLSTLLLLFFCIEITDPSGINFEPALWFSQRSTPFTSAQENQVPQ